MITNKIAYWRSTMNQGKGISQAHFARQIGVGRSFVTKLEKGAAQPGAELMFRTARYFKQPVEAVFQQLDDRKSKPAPVCAEAMPVSQFHAFASVPAKPLRTSKAAPSACPAESVEAMDKSLVGPTAKAVASPVAQSSRKKTK
jgi:DNA-binding XRE family transcriptional regulator